MTRDTNNGALHGARGTCSWLPLQVKSSAADRPAAAQCVNECLLEVCVG
jgi:hypothetical protein